MLNVTSIVEEDVLCKVDARSVKALLKQLLGPAGDHLAITLVCVNDRDWKEESWRKKGRKYVTVRLPYETIKTLSVEEARPLVFQTVWEKLGLRAAGEG